MGVRLLAGVLLACGGLACSGAIPTAPEPGSAAGHPTRSVEMAEGARQAPAQSPTSGSVVARDAQPSARYLPMGKRTDPEGAVGGVDTLPAAPAWYTVASKTMLPLLGGTVSGSRYRVTVLPLSLTSVTTISIREHSPDVIDFELLPHGTQFLLPVTVDVDYAGTSLDPAHPDYDGGLPILLWLNPTTGRWELVVGVDNPLTKKYTVLLTHFSRYAMGRQSGTAEW
jgi:hypothetical protein